MLEVTIVNYGVGNLMSVLKAFEFIGCKATLTDDPEAVAKASCLVLPGVGAYGAGMKKLGERCLVEPIKEAIWRGTPTLGICLGMQLMMSYSEEGGVREGLNVISGRVIPLPKSPALKVPHIGWNSINIRKQAPLFHGLSGNPMVYFVHSFHVVPDDDSIVVATTWYGVEFVSAICTGNVCGTQFHPEKSGRVGLSIIRNFVEFAKGKKRAS
jgi:glutamine amidotransferase